MTKRFIVLFGLMMSAVAVNAEPLVAGDIEAGKQKSATCAACHGPQGNMESAQFPKLAGQGSPYLYHQLKMFKSGQRQNAVMAGQVAAFSDQDMKDLGAYFAAQQMRPGAADEAIAPAGAVLYHAGKAEKDIPACAGCHGPAGIGNAAAMYPRLSGQSSPYIVAQLTAYREGKRSGYPNATIMNGVAENLTDNDIKALASYVAGLAPAPEDASNDKGALMQNVSATTPAQAKGDDKSSDGSGPARGQSQDQGQGKSDGAKPAEGKDDAAQPQAGADSKGAAAADSDSEAAGKGQQTAGSDTNKATAASKDASAPDDGDAGGDKAGAGATSAASSGNSGASSDKAAGKTPSAGGNKPAQDSAGEGRSADTGDNSDAGSNAAPNGAKGNDEGGAAAAAPSGSDGAAASGSAASGDGEAAKQDSGSAESGDGAADDGQSDGGENAGDDSRSKTPSQSTDDAS